MIPQMAPSNKKTSPPRVYLVFDSTVEPVQLLAGLTRLRTPNSFLQKKTKRGIALEELFL